MRGGAAVCLRLQAARAGWQGAQMLQVHRVHSTSKVQDAAAAVEQAADHDQAPPLVGSSEDYARFAGMSGAEILQAILVERNVTQVFGYPGGAILPVFDTIHDDPNFKFVLPRHEQGGGHMAEGYARVTGKPGVVIVTSGGCSQPPVFRRPADRRTRQPLPGGRRAAE